ncbi:recombinase family protein [Endozoicomonas sp.]|uniref:recombinase family protein n=1 Tax=Endozoicomonas sp. TaxID=1892382 RepID=UPI00383A2FEC
MATVAYYRVSTKEQSIENQRMELEKVYQIERDFMDNAVSGTIKTADREGFSAMLNYVRDGDTLITVDIDRLGRDAIDVQQTIAKLKGMGVNIIITRLGVDLDSDAGELLITIMSKVAEMERRKMLERQRAGIARAKAEGKYKGSQKSVEPEVVKSARKTMSIADTAEHLGISVATVKRLQKAN